MNTIILKTGLPTLRCSIHTIKSCVCVDRVKGKKTLVFLQNVLSKISLECTNATQVHEITLIQKRNCPDTPGSGAGRTGGGSKRIGTIGKFGDMNEEQFFYKQQKAQMERLKLELEKKAQEKGNVPEKEEK